MGQQSKQQEPEPEPACGAAPAANLYEPGGRLADDPCAMYARMLENEALSQYTLYDRYDACRLPCGERRQAITHAMLAHPTLQAQDGFGPSACEIDADSAARHDAAWTNSKDRQQLPSRVFTAVPDLSRGRPFPCIESRLSTGPTDTTLVRHCAARLAEVDFDRFQPGGVDVQDVRKIVLPGARGGESSRLLSRDPAFLRSMGYDVYEEGGEECA